MEKSIISTGKTIDAATEAALERLGLERDHVSVEVLETPRSGFLGIGAVPAKIKVSYEAPDEPETAAPAPALSSASRNTKPSQFERLQAEKRHAEEEKAAQMAKAAAEAAAQAAEQVAAAEAAEKQASREEQPKPKNDRPNRDRRNRRSRGQRQERSTRPEKQSEFHPAPKAPAEPLPPYVTPEPGSMEARIETFLNGLMEKMGSEAKAQAVKQSEERYHVDLVGADLGMLIGRRGDTLDAIQHLTNYALGRGESRHMRITVDAEGYRAKREGSLERLAYKTAEKVLRYRRNWTMEPMNAYERHVIHAALQEYEGISTYSIGTDPNRRVVVAYGSGKTAPEEEKAE